jgi:hypothetical protein
MSQTRPDGRGHDQARPIEIVTNFQTFPEGSVLYRCGGTTRADRRVGVGGVRPADWMRDTGTGLAHRRVRDAPPRQPRAPAPRPTARAASTDAARARSSASSGARCAPSVDMRAARRADDHRRLRRPRRGRRHAHRLPSPAVSSRWPWRSIALRASRDSPSPGVHPRADRRDQRWTRRRSSDARSLLHGGSGRRSGSELRRHAWRRSGRGAGHGRGRAVARADFDGLVDLAVGALPTLVEHQRAALQKAGVDLDRLMGPG